MNPDAPWLGDTPQARCWNRFVAMTPEKRLDSFKVIISVEKGPWLVKRAAAKKPVIIGRQVAVQTHHEEGKHMEIVVDVSTGKAEKMAASIVIRAIHNLTVSLATLIEAKCEDELPEAILLCPSLQGLDCSRLACPEL
eukprot:NODE_21766_length_737_cov_4.647541.p3 GENE.NODE_21766_length_737_cov_4.647541~~NODE_21766_length_737_cov_4.647541.p3  ORF type:complete len:138 (-),score=37.84 NODE_21766_length_737_cov_4.647541:46-459(-)